MAITNNILGNTAASSIFTSTGTNGDIVTVMYLCNTDSSFQTANVFLVANTNLPDPALNIIYSNVLINAGDTLVIDMEKIVLNTNDYVAANCSASGNVVIATVSSLAV